MSSLSLLAPPRSVATSARRHTLTVVIPALNEEGAIGSTIERCLEARDEIKRGAGLEEIEIIVVSDGSTDRTVEIARSFTEIKVVVFERNRGYGAAIKEGFRQGSGDLLAFLDADGTCDPRFFAEMCRVALEEDADIVLGSRMGPDSKMPPLRRLGNRIFAFLLGLLCGRYVTDTASGMRVLRRSSLDFLYPLPDRLHFTPSMSARALTNGLRLLEIPMHYEERIGESKLRVFNDGLLFLRTIIEGVLCYRPERFFLIVSTLFFGVAVLMAMYPTEYYWHHRRVEEWMIYRFIACFLLGNAAYLLVGAAVLSNRMAALGPKRRGGESFGIGVLKHLFHGWPLVLFCVAVLTVSLGLIWPGLVEYVGTRGITLHWSRIIVAAFGFLSLFQTLVIAVLLEVVSLWRFQLEGAERQLHETNCAADCRKTGKFAQLKGRSMNGLIPAMHGALVYHRRIRRLGEILAEVIPREASVLDVGCGDGLLSRRIKELRPDIDVRGIDVLVRRQTHIPVKAFDGATIPEPSGAVDIVLFVDVLHHTVDPNVLLREAARVARRGVVIKDHTQDRALAGPTLRFMDFVGNAHHGVALPYNYWPRRRLDRNFPEDVLVSFRLA